MVKGLGVTRRWGSGGVVGRVWLLALIALICAFALLVDSAGAVDPQPSCGQVVTESVTLTGDVAGCLGDGLVVGADGITIDLAGHSVTAAGPALCDGGCIGIDNRAGHDGVQIVNGTVSGFGRGVVFDDGDGGTLSNLTVRHGGNYGEPGTAVRLHSSDRTSIDRLSAIGGDPAVVLSDSDENTLTRSDVLGGVSIRVGDALWITDGSDGNRVHDTTIDGEHRGFSVSGSDNTLTNVRAYGYGGNVLMGSSRTRVGRSVLNGGQGTGLEMVGANATLVDRNEISGWAPLRVHDSVGTEVVRNHVTSGFPDLANIAVDAGDGTTLRRNVVEGSLDGIFVSSSAGHVLVVGNRATRALDDGIDVRAPGTVIRANSANDNGDLGIEAVQGAIDGGGNRAVGNGNPQQCVGVRCRP